MEKIDLENGRLKFSKKGDWNQRMVVNHPDCQAVWMRQEHTILDIQSPTHPHTKVWQFLKAIAFILSPIWK
ncbi:hypothetical protein [Helicobacter bizzozeronii]|uniref:hypothetical protein n=1 Tax=Helicobacter bizzozeronii TaxID=56877 RepID=UPI0025576494|nr:hypothetical protein [Helicobacter bizzozeronii]